MTAKSEVTANACLKLVEAAAQSCAAPKAPVTPVTPTPEWDAVANSLSGIGVAVAVGAAVLAVASLLAGLAWATIVSHQAKKAAEEAAREEARRCAEEHMKRWLAEEAPQMISKHIWNILDTDLSDGDDSAAAEEIGKGV